MVYSARVGEFALPYNCRFGGWMKSLLMALLMAFFLAASPAQQQRVGEKLPSTSLQGFTASSAQAERTWESKFRAIPNTDNLREYMRLMSSHPHHVGQPWDKQNPNGCWPASKNGDGTLASKISMCCSPLPKNVILNCWSRPGLLPNWKNRQSPLIRPLINRLNSCRPTTPIPLMATSPAPWCT